MTYNQLSDNTDYRVEECKQDRNFQNLKSIVLYYLIVILAFWIDRNNAMYRANIFQLERCQHRVRTSGGGGEEGEVNTPA